MDNHNTEGEKAYIVANGVLILVLMDNHNTQLSCPH